MFKVSYVYLASVNVYISLEDRKVMKPNGVIVGVLNTDMIEEWEYGDLNDADKTFIEIYFNDLI